jgi:predicted metal-dependent peptidase
LSPALSSSILKARIDLMLDQPYLSSAVARYPLVDATGYEWCPTLATDGYNVFANSDFCKTLNTDEAVFVFAHEIIHCMFGHIDRRKDRVPLLWNYAIDYATNLMLKDFGLKMPEIGLIDERYRHMTAEQIYDSLVSSENKAKEDSRGSRIPCSSLAEEEPFDLHLEPTDSRAQALRTEDPLSPDERFRLRKNLTRSLEQKLKSSEAGYNEGEIGMAEGGKVPWQELLAQFFSGLSRDNYRMLPPNKKHLWRGLYLPSLGVPGPDHVAVAIDTSGSMSDDELSKVLAEVDRLRSLSQCSLTLIQCDAKIQEVERFDEWDEAEFSRKRMHGRGGTSFVPVFEWLQREQETAGMTIDCLFYLTDGGGDGPSEEPPYPVVWVVTEHHIDNFSFGSVIEL